MRLLRVLPAVLALLPGLLIAQGPAASTTNLPIRSVSLFSSGVGYFEHAGTVNGSTSAELRFKTVQINDVLKSLTLQDLDGGRVSAITYPSQDPIAKTLRSFQVDITSNPNMASLLNQLRGARITAQSGVERMTGTILGVEMGRAASAPTAPSDVPILNLLTGAMIRSVDLTRVTSLTLEDPELQAELTRALAALGQARDQDKKAVTIQFLGNGARRVRVGYVVETPIWKTSYRLLVDEKGGWIQGWAIVENQTDSDWRDVSLSLISGRPISFMMDLYQPLYLRRPTVVPELFAGLTPQRYGAGTSRSAVDGAFVDRLPGDIAVSAKANPLVPRDQVATRQLIEDASITTGNASAEFGNAQGGVIAITTRSDATGTRLGELFQYTIAGVTLARQQSAMLPIVTDSVGIERLSIYNGNVHPRYALNGVRLKNTTGKHFLQGPVTVLEKGSYAGDAQIDNVPPGQERLLSYGVDLELLVDNSKRNQTMPVVTAKIAKGIMTLERKLIASQEYLVDNKGSREKRVLIEHPVRAGWTLSSDSKAVESTDLLHRFQMTAASGKATAFTVKEESARSERVVILSAGLAPLLSYQQLQELPSAVRDALAKAIRMKQETADLELQVAARTTQLAEITAEQDRIRENLKTVEAKSAYASRLLAKLNEQESSIERLQRERDDLLERRDGQRRALEEYLANLTVG